MAFINKEVSTMAMPSGMNRMGQFPLDMSSVYYDMESLEAYAKSGSIAYVGQIVSLVDEANNKVTVYSIQNKAGDLKEVGVIPTGDDKTIKVEDGKISLSVIKEEGVSGGAQLTLTDDGKLKWVMPNTETIEGQGAAIKALQDTVGKPAEGENEATGLYGLISAEEARALAAEKVLSEAIAAIDFIDDKELEEAIKDFVTKTEFSTELAKKVNTSDYTNDKKALDEAIKAAKDAADAAQDTIDHFLTGEGVDPDIIETLKEIQTALKDFADAEEMIAALNQKADKETVAADLALKADKADTEAALASKAVKTEVETALGLKADKTTLAADKAELTQAIADAKAAAIADAATAAAGLYVEKTSFNSTVETINTEINKKADANSVYTKEEVYTKTEIDNAGYATETYVNTELKKESDRAKLAEEANATEITSIKTGYATDKAVFEQGILDAKNLGNQGINNAAAADAKAVAAGNKAAENATEITSIKERLTAAEGQGTTNANAISGLDTRLANAETTLTSKADKTVVDPLVTAVGEHTGLIAELQSADASLSAQVELKADKSSVYSKDQIDTKVSEINNEIGKAKTEASKAVNDLATGAVATNAADIKAIYTAAEGENPASGVLVDLVKAEENRAKEVEADFEDRIAEMETFWDAADDPTGTIDKLTEIVDYIEKHEELNIPASINANTAAIKNIYTAADGETPASGVLVNEIAAAKAYADTAAANAVAGIPAATKEKLGLVKIDDNTITVNDNGQIRVSKITEDVVFEGTFILNGGTAKE